MWAGSPPTHIPFLLLSNRNVLHPGHDAWKQEPRSPDYDWELIQAKLNQLRDVRQTTQSQSAMIFALRTSLARNLGDMGNPKVRKTK